MKALTTMKLSEAFRWMAIIALGTSFGHHVSFIFERWFSALSIPLLIVVIIITIAYEKQCHRSENKGLKQKLNKGVQ